MSFWCLLVTLGALFLIFEGPGNRLEIRWFFGVPGGAQIKNIRPGKVTSWFLGLGGTIRDLQSHLLTCYCWPATCNCRLTAANWQLQTCKLTTADWQLQTDNCRLANWQLQTDNCRLANWQVQTSGLEMNENQLNTWLSTCDWNDWNDLGTVTGTLLLAAWWPLTSRGRRIYILMCSRCISMRFRYISMRFNMF